FYISPTGDVPAHWVDKMEVFPQKKIPAFIQALESPNLNDKNAVLAQLGLKLKSCEPIERMVICRWPDNSEARWGGTGKVGDWEYKPMDDGADRGKPKDSCVVLYWGELNMPPRSTRKLGFTYGLGRIPGDPTSKGTALALDGGLRLFVGNRAVVKEP